MPVQLHQKVVRLGENYVNAGLRELSPQASKSPQSSSLSGSSATDTYHVVVTTSTAVVFWATTVKSESGVCVCVCLCVYVCGVCAGACMRACVLCCVYVCV